LLDHPQPLCTGHDAQSTDHCDASLGCDGAPAAFVYE
jgi:hypothetical protein